MTATFSHCILQVAQVRQCTQFLVEQFDFTCAATDDQRVVLVPASGSVSVELRKSTASPEQRAGFTADDGYWKLGFTCPDIVALRQRLLQVGDVGQVGRFADIGVLCHLGDPDGFPIELLDQRLGAGAETAVEATNTPTFAHVTLRVRDAEASLRFYRDTLGMQLLSTQVLAPYEFTLYFLASTDETAPDLDDDPVVHREWLWRRPYTCLELQHFWGSRVRREPYQLYHDAPHGFWGLGFKTDDLRQCPLVTGGNAAPVHDPMLDAGTLVVHDPDGYALRLHAAAMST